MSPLRSRSVALGLLASLSACSPKGGGALELCASTSEPADEDSSDGSPLVIERAGLRVAPPAEAEIGGCGQMFELVADDGERIHFGFSLVYGENDQLDDERDVAARLTLSQDATVRIRFVPAEPWGRGPSLLVEDELGILVAGQRFGRSDEPEDFGDLLVEEEGESLPYFGPCGTMTQHDLRFTADTSVVVPIAETETIASGDVDLAVRTVGASTVDWSGTCTDGSSGTFRSWLAVRQPVE